MQGYENKITSLIYSDILCFIKFQKVGLETESHVTREFNKLIEIIQQKKQSLIEQITNEYNLLVGDSTNHTAQLQNEIEINRALEEIISFTFENGDDNALLEVSSFFVVFVFL